jgi:hypothetical protein
MSRDGIARLQGAWKGRRAPLKVPRRASARGDAEHLRRGQIGATVVTADHEDALRIHLRTRAPVAQSLHRWPRLKLHRLEIEYLYI